MECVLGRSAMSSIADIKGTPSLGLLFIPHGNISSQLRLDEMLQAMTKSASGKVRVVNQSALCAAQLSITQTPEQKSMDLKFVHLVRVDVFSVNVTDSVTSPSRSSRLVSRDWPRFLPRVKPAFAASEQGPGEGSPSR